MSPNVTIGLPDAMANVSSVTAPLTSFAGNFGILLGAIILIVAFFLFMKFVKNIIANTIIGIVGLIILKFILGVSIPLNALTVLIVVVTGIPGLAVLLIAVFLGLL